MERDNAVNRASLEERDARGEWNPGLVVPAPLYYWPPRVLEIIKWLFGYPGYFFPWIGFFMLLPLLTWFYLIPDLSHMKTFEMDWIALDYFRNLILLILIAGGFHFRLYVQKAQVTTSTRVLTIITTKKSKLVPGPASQSIL